MKQRWTDDYVVNSLGGWFSSEHLRTLATLTSSLVEMIFRQLTDNPLGSTIGGVVGVSILVLATVGTADRAHALRRSGRDIGPTGRGALVIGLVLGAKFIVDMLVAPVWVLSWYSAPLRTAAAFGVGAAAGAGARVIAARHEALIIPVLLLGAVAILPGGVDDTLHGRVGCHLTGRDRSCDGLGAGLWA